MSGVEQTQVSQTFILGTALEPICALQGGSTPVPVLAQSTESKLSDADARQFMSRISVLRSASLDVSLDQKLSENGEQWEKIKTTYLADTRIQNFKPLIHFLSQHSGLEPLAQKRTLFLEWRQKQPAFNQMSTAYDFTISKLDDQIRAALTWQNTKLQALGAQNLTQFPSDLVSEIQDGGSYYSSAEWGMYADFLSGLGLGNHVKSVYERARDAAPTRAEEMWHWANTISNTDWMDVKKLSDLDQIDRQLDGINSIIESTLSEQAAIEDQPEPYRSIMQSPEVTMDWRKPGSYQQLHLVQALLSHIHVRSVIARSMIAETDDEKDVARASLLKLGTQLHEAIRSRYNLATVEESQFYLFAVRDYSGFVSRVGGEVAQEYAKGATDETINPWAKNLKSLALASDILTKPFKLSDASSKRPAVLEESLAAIYWNTQVEMYRRMGNSRAALGHLNDIVIPRFSESSALQLAVADLRKEAPHLFDACGQLHLQDFSGTAFGENAASRAKSWAMVDRQHFGRDVSITGTGIFIGGGIGFFAGGGPLTAAGGGAIGGAIAESSNVGLSIYDHGEAITDARATGLTDVTARLQKMGNWLTGGGMALSVVFGAFGGGALANGTFKGLEGMTFTAMSDSLRNAGWRNAFSMTGNSLVRRLLPHDEWLKWAGVVGALDFFVLHTSEYGHLELKTDFKFDTPLRWVALGLAVFSPQVQSALKHGPVETIAGATDVVLGEVFHAGVMLKALGSGLYGVFKTHKAVEKVVVKLTDAEKLAVFEEVVREIPGIAKRDAKLGKVTLSQLSSDDFYAVARRYQARLLEKERGVEPGTVTLEEVEALQEQNFNDWYSRLPNWRKDRGLNYWRVRWDDAQVVQGLKVPERMRIAQANLRSTRSVPRVMDSLYKVNNSLQEFLKGETGVNVTTQLSELAERGSQLQMEASISGIEERIYQARLWRHRIHDLVDETHALLKASKQDMNAAKKGLQRVEAQFAELYSEMQNVDIAMRKPYVNGDSGIIEIGQGDLAEHTAMAVARVGYGNVPNLEPNGLLTQSLTQFNRTTGWMTPVEEFVGRRVDSFRAAVDEYVPDFEQDFQHALEDKMMFRHAWEYDGNNGLTTTAPMVLRGMEKMPKVWVERLSRKVSSGMAFFPSAEMVQLHRFGLYPVALDMVTAPTKDGGYKFNLDGTINCPWGYLGAVAGGNYLANKVGFNKIMGADISSGIYFATLQMAMYQTDDEHPVDWRKQYANYKSWVAQMTTFPIFNSGINQLNKVKTLKLAYLPVVRQLPSVTSFNSAYWSGTSMLNPNTFTPHGLALGVGVGAPLFGVGMGMYFSGKNYLDAGGYYPKQRSIKLAIAAVAINPAQTALGYTGVLSQAVGRTVGFGVEYGLNKFTPQFMGKKLFDVKADRLLDENTDESLDLMWDLYVAQSSTKDMGGLTAEVYVPKAARAKHEDPSNYRELHVGPRMEPIGNNDFMEWKEKELEAQSYLETLAQKHPERVYKFTMAFKRQLVGTSAKWRQDDRHGMAVVQYAMSAKYLAKIADSGEAVLKPFSDLVHDSTLASFWNDIPAINSLDELNTRIEEINRGKFDIQRPLSALRRLH